MATKLTPIYLAGRLLGYRDSNGNRYQAGTIAESPMVFSRGGELFVRGGSEVVNERLLEMTKPEETDGGEGIQDAEGHDAQGEGVTTGSISEPQAHDETHDETRDETPVSRKRRATLRV